MSTVAQLPARLSALLRLAVADAQKCELDPKYELNMHVWYCPPRKSAVENLGSRKCLVCMAGSVIAQTLPRPADYNEDYVVPSDFDGITERRLEAIDAIRSGSVSAALGVLGVSWARDSDTVEAVAAAARAIDRGKLRGAGRSSWESYLAAADLLAGAGL